MDELTRSLLSQAIDRRAWSVGWAVLLTIAAIFVHAFTFAPYVEISLQKRETDGYLSVVNGVKGQVDALAPELQAVLDALQQRGQQLGDDLRQSLLRDFARLEASRRQALMGQSNAAAPPSPALPPVQAPLPNPNLMIQMPLALAAAPPEPFDIGDAAFREALLGNDRDHMLRQLSPFVGRLIVEPRYQSINQQWSQSVAPVLTLVIDKVASQTATLASGHAEFAADLDRFKTLLDDIKQRIVGMRFTPPTADRWWATALGNGAAGAEISANVLAFQEPLVQQLHILAGSIAAVGDAQKALAAEYASRLEAIRKDFAEQVGKLSSLSAPLGVFRRQVGADYLTRPADKIRCQEGNLAHTAANIQYAHTRRHTGNLKPLARRRVEDLCLSRESLKFEFGMTEQVGRIFDAYLHPRGERLHEVPAG
jgi:hypothetical protein